MAKKELTFEDKLARLEAIANSLETGKEGLEKSLQLFEEGVTLSKELTDTLKDVKMKVEILKKDAEGKLNPEPFGQEEDGAN